MIDIYKEMSDNKSKIVDKFKIENGEGPYTAAELKGTLIRKPHAVVHDIASKDGQIAFLTTYYKELQNQTKPYGHDRLTKSELLLGENKHPTLLLGVNKLAFRKFDNTIKQSYLESIHEGLYWSKPVHGLVTTTFKEVLTQRDELDLKLLKVLSKSDISIQKQQEIFKLIASDAPRSNIPTSDINKPNDNDPHPGPTQLMGIIYTVEERICDQTENANKINYYVGPILLSLNVCSELIYINFINDK